MGLLRYIAYEGNERQVVSQREIWKILKPCWQPCLCFRCAQLAAHAYEATLLHFARYPQLYRRVLSSDLTNIHPTAGFEDETTA